MSNEEEKPAKYPRFSVAPEDPLTGKDHHKMDIEKVAREEMEQHLGMLEFRIKSIAENQDLLRKDIQDIVDNSVKSVLNLRLGSMESRIKGEANSMVDYKSQQLLNREQAKGMIDIELRGVQLWVAKKVHGS